MFNFYLRMRNWLEREQGQDLAEYALLVGLIALVVYAAVNALGLNLSNIFQAMADEVASWGIP